MNAQRPLLLIVEDDPGLLADYQDIFSAYHELLEVVVAGDAHETLRQLEGSRGERPLAMLLDLMMPYGAAMDLLGGQTDPDEIETGVRLLHHLRAQERENALPPIWVAVATARSAYVIDAQLRELLGDRGRLFLKPFDTLRLEHEVASALGLPSHVPAELVAPIDSRSGGEQR